MPPGQVLWHIDIHLSMFFYEMVVWEADDLVVFFWVSLVGYVGFVECSWSSRKQFSEDRTELIFHERGLTLPLSHLLLHIAQKRLVYQYISKSVSCIISYHTISYHIISYHIISYFISCHVTSHHFISCIAKTTCSRKSDCINLLDLELSLTPLKFNSSPLKIGGWKTILAYWGPVTFQGRTVKLREGKPILY